jgi:AcrR family transcriptional regulator
MGARTATARRYAGKSAEERDDERRTRLLDAGLEVFGTVGYAGSAIETICSTARVATREFYALFGTKERLLLEVDARIVSEAAEGITAALDATPEGVAPRIRAGLRAYADVFADNARRARVHFFEVLAVAADAGGHRRVTGDQLMAIFLAEGQRLMGLGLIPQRDLSITSGALLGATRYAMTDWATDPSRHSVDEVIDELVRLYVMGLSHDPAGREADSLVAQP